MGNFFRSCLNGLTFAVKPWLAFGIFLPIIFFVFDKEEYELTRGVHRTIDEFAPGKICKTFDEVAMAILQNDFDIEKTYQFVRDNFDSSEGLSSDKVIDNIILKKFSR